MRAAYFLFKSKFFKSNQLTSSPIISNLVDPRAGENLITYFPEEIVLNFAAPPNNIVSKFNNIIVKRNDLYTLCGREWLNDQGTLCLKVFGLIGF